MRTTREGETAPPRQSNLVAYFDLLARFVIVGEAFHEIEDALAHLVIRDAHESHVELQAFPAGCKMHQLRRFGLFHNPMCAPGWGVAKPVIEVTNVDTQDVCNLEKTTGANSVNSSLVLLNLLEGKPEKLPQLLLAHSNKHSPQPDLISDMRVNRVRLFLWHNPDTRI